MSEMKKRRLFVAALAAGFLFTGCEDGLNSANKNIPPKTVSVTDGGGLLYAAGNPDVEVIEIDAETDMDASDIDLDIKTAKTILIPTGLAVSAKSVKAYAGIVIGVKDEGAVPAGAALNRKAVESGFDSDGSVVLKVNGEFYVDRGAVFEVKENANLAFGSTVKSVTVDGVLRCGDKEAIYTLGNGGLEVNGSGDVRIGDESTAAGEFKLIARDSGDEGGGGDAPASPADNLAAIGYRSTADSDGKVEFVTDGWEERGKGTAEEGWILNAIEEPAVYFAVKKTAGQTITAGGADAEKVTVTTDGSTVDGSATSDTLAAVTVDASDFDTLFEGKSYNFTLKVLENRRRIKTINVTLNNAIDDTYGVTIFRVRYPDGKETLEKLDAKIGAQTSRNKAEDIETIDIDPQPVNRLYDANRWLEYNAEDKGEYLIRLNRDQMTEPVIFKMTDNTGVTVRLRGAGGERKIMPVESFEWSNTSGSNVGGIFNYAHVSYGKGLIIAGDNIDRPLTLKLEKNVTIDGLRGYDKKHFANDSALGSLLQINKSVTVYMEAGSKITGFYGEAGIDKVAPVYVGGITNLTGKLVMKKGSAITGNEFYGSMLTTSLKWGMVLVYQVTAENFIFQRVGAETIYENIPATRRVFYTANSTDMY
jgi:hypothetical protein